MLKFSHVFYVKFWEKRKEKNKHACDLQLIIFYFLFSKKFSFFVFCFFCMGDKNKMWRRIWAIKKQIPPRRTWEVGVRKKTQDTLEGLTPHDTWCTMCWPCVNKYVCSPNDTKTPHLWWTCLACNVLTFFVILCHLLLHPKIAELS